jgi:two-component system, LytTR family, sensor kinase
LINSYFRFGKQFHVEVTLLTYLLKGIVIYTVGLYVLPKYLNKQRISALIISFVLLYWFYFAISYLLEAVFEVWYYKTEPFDILIPKYLLLVVPYFIQTTVIGLAYYFIRIAEQKKAELAETRARQLEAEARNSALEREKLMLENDYRRAQINPHFLMNTLNGITTAINLKDPNAAEYVVMLGELMSYSMSEPAADNKVLLKDEVAAIETLLKLIAMRYYNNFSVRFTKEGEIENQRILPLALMTLVENCIKYGYINNPDKPAVLHLTVSNSQLHFEAANYINPNRAKQSSHGIGLNNMKRRLELTYGSNFSYDAVENETTYRASLTLML